MAKINDMIAFDVKGEGTLTAVDSSDPVSHESFLGKQHTALAGLVPASVTLRTVKC